MDNKKTSRPAATKKSGHPTQPGNRSAASRPTKRKKCVNILNQIAREIKSAPVVFSVMLVTIIFAVSIILYCAGCANTPDTTKPIKMTLDQFLAVFCFSGAAVSGIYLWGDNRGGWPMIFYKLKQKFKRHQKEADR